MLLKNKNYWSKRENLIDFIKGFLNRAASHVQVEGENQHPDLMYGSDFSGSSQHTRYILALFLINR